MGSAGLALIDIIDDMVQNLYEGEYDGCNGPWDREMLFDIERHPRFKVIKDYPKTPDEYITSIDILNLVKYIDRHRRAVRDEMARKLKDKDTV